MLSFLSTLLLVASAVAAPHSYHHLFLHSRSLDLTPIAGRSISDIGLCGGDTGFQCAEGFCCSKWGYCGTTADYCGTGGEGSENVTSSALPSATQVFNIPTSSPQTPVPTSTSVVQYTTFATLASSSAPTSSPVYVTPTPVATTEAPSSTLSSAPAASSSPASSSGSSSGSGQGLGNVFKMYSGDGTSAQGWPSMSEWVDFDTMWTSNSARIACDATWGVAQNSDEETANIKTSIQSVASSTGVDERYILAIVMQESSGCVRVPTTAYSHPNPGLMQSDEGKGSCNPTGGSVQNPCPASEIQQMVEDGTAGTGSYISGGLGMQQYISLASSKYSATGASEYYVAARLYNSGVNSIPATQFDLSSDGATSCYSAEVANRLTGWTGGAASCS